MSLKVSIQNIHILYGNEWKDSGQTTVIKKRVVIKTIKLFKKLVLIWVYRTVLDFFYLNTL